MVLYLDFDLKPPRHSQNSCHAPKIDHVAVIKVSSKRCFHFFSPGWEKKWRVVNVMVSGHRRYRSHTAIKDLTSEPIAALLQIETGSTTNACKRHPLDEIKASLKCQSLWCYCWVDMKAVTAMSIWTRLLTKTATLYATSGNSVWLIQMSMWRNECLPQIHGMEQRNMK